MYVTVDKLTSQDYRAIPHPSIPVASPWNSIVGAWPGELSLLKAAFDRLESFAELRQDWDLEGGRPIAAVAIDGAKHAVARLAKIASVETSPLGSGGVLLEWKIGQRSFQLEVFAGGSAEWNSSGPRDEDEGGRFTVDEHQPLPLARVSSF